ncbi:ATP13A1 [Bugula neritina]|uniref:ATP13A1 n=1 Tax=Bugula neritina TaxID=10212 RepID=A0A7J7KJ62_BUGNE|nr:ATP13A1 [Bugula neritina]
MYLISMSLQVSTVAVNYKGRPFMQSLRENKLLFYSIGVSTFVIFSLASGMMPELAEYIELVPFPSEFRNVLVMVLLVDFIGAWLADRVCQFLFERTKPKSIWKL